MRGLKISRIKSKGKILGIFRLKNKSVDGVTTKNIVSEPKKSLSNGAKVFFIFGGMFIILAGIIFTLMWQDINKEKSNKGKLKHYSYSFLLEDELARKGTPKAKRMWKSETLRNKMTDKLVGISADLGLNLKDLLKLISLESQWNYRAKSKKPNSDGSRDFGLTQQNAYHVQSRCKKLYGVKCSTSDLFDPFVSVELMAETLRECKVHNKGVWIFVCYNSPRNAKNHINTYWTRKKYDALTK